MDLTLVNGATPPEVVRYAEKNATSSSTLFIAYLQKYYGEIVERIFAARTQKKRTRLTEVCRTATGKAKPIVKNLLWSVYGAYTAVYEKGNVYKSAGGYPYLAFSESDYDRWEKVDVAPGVCKVYVNAVDFLAVSEEFKYSGYSGGDAIHWCNEYRKDPSIEMLGKLGLGLSPKLRSHIKKDGQFRRFVFEHHAEVDLYGVEATEYAYKHKMSIEKARRVCSVKREYDRLAAIYIPALKKTNIDRQKVIDWCDSNNVSYSTYNDYLTAVKGFRLDLSDTKNIFPKHFNEMHDEYVARYKAEQTELFERDFKEAAQKMQHLAYNRGAYLIDLPKETSDLTKEGKALSHCVGRMGYGKKMAEGKSVILFVRKKDDPDTPFITVEYDPKRKVILQSHGKNNTLPSEDVRAFLDKWLDHIKERKKQ